MCRKRNSRDVPQFVEQFVFHINQSINGPLQYHDAYNRRIGQQESQLKQIHGIDTKQDKCRSGYRIDSEAFAMQQIANDDKTEHQGSAQDGRRQSRNEGIKPKDSKQQYVPQSFMPLFLSQKTKHERGQQINDSHMHPRHAKNVHRTCSDIFLAHLVLKKIIVTQKNGCCNPKLMVFQAAFAKRSRQFVAKTIRESKQGIGILFVQAHPILLFQKDLSCNAPTHQESPVIELLGVFGRRHFPNGGRQNQQIAILKCQCCIRFLEVGHHVPRNRLRRHGIAKLTLQFELHFNIVFTLGRIFEHAGYVIPRIGLVIAVIILVDGSLMKPRQSISGNNKVTSHDGTKKPDKTIAFQLINRHQSHGKQSQHDGKQSPIRKLNILKKKPKPDTQRKGYQYSDKRVFAPLGHKSIGTTHPFKASSMMTEAALSEAPALPKRSLNSS